ncbi:hypothetical protein ACFLSE_05545, partial [Bacteroidota bacterium]
TNTLENQFVSKDMVNDLLRAKVNKFGVYSLKNEPQIILCPNIAKGKYKNGYMIYDTITMNLNVIGL